MNVLRKQTTIPRIALTLALIAGALMAAPAFANGSDSPQEACERQGGFFIPLLGASNCILHCSNGTILIAANITDLEYDPDTDTYFWHGLNCPPNSLRCGTVDLPRVVTQSDAQPISWKGSIRQVSAALSIPGVGGSFPVYGLSYDFGTKTWMGYINTALIPPGDYAGARLIISDKNGETKACNIGGLEVLDG